MESDPSKQRAFDPSMVELISMIESSDHDMEHTFRCLATAKTGLPHLEAARRLAHFGPNKLSGGGAMRWYHHLWNAFVHPFNLLLLTLAIISGVSDDPISSYVMATLVLISVVLRFWQERKSAIAADALKRSITKNAVVIRGDEKLLVDFESIVPGDVVELSAGSLVPADLRLIAVEHLLVNESALTGESMPAEKTVAAWSEQESASPEPGVEAKLPANPRSGTSGASDESVIHRLNLAFMGTSVESGWAVGVVLSCGDNTFTGKHAKTLVTARPPAAFSRGVKRVSYLLIAFMAALVPAVVCIYGFLNNDWSEGAMFGIAIAVGLTPEMLPMILNTNLARGAHVLSKQKVIVKRLEAIQNFGAMTVLCTDKTGTLTEDNVVLGDILDVSGQKSTRTLHYAYYIAHYQTGFRNPLDQAIIDFVTEKKVLDLQPLQAVRKLAELPFDFKRRRMSVLVSTTQRSMPLFNVADEAVQTVDIDVPLLCCKGAVEEMLERCTHYHTHSGARKVLGTEARWQVAALVSKWNAQGLRLLAVAVKEWREQRTELKVEDESELTLTGFLAFHDPPKRDANQGIAEVLEKGCLVKVLTGDNILVARKVCSDLGLSVEHTITGEELAQVPEEEWAEVCKRTTVFAKLSPGQKAMVVRSLKDNGETVGFLGDGINDALALREADVGISVDTGTDLAKEAADIILLEKSLRVLSRAITEGRRTHGNTLKYIKMAASSNFGNVFSLLVASSWLPFLPMRPIHILTQNLLYDISQVSIPWDRMDAEYLARPQGWSAKGIFWFMVWLGPVSSIFDVATFVYMWYYFDCKDPDDDEKVALFQSCWFVLGLLTQVLIVHMIRTEKVPFVQSWAAPGVLVLSGVIAVIGVVLPNISALAGVFMFVPIPAMFYPFLVGCIVAYCVLTQLIKVVYKKIYNEWL